MNFLPFSDNLLMFRLVVFKVLMPIAPSQIFVNLDIPFQQSLITKKLNEIKQNW